MLFIKHQQKSPGNVTSTQVLLTLLTYILSVFHSNPFTEGFKHVEQIQVLMSLVLSTNTLINYTLISLLKVFNMVNSPHLTSWTCRYCDYVLCNCGTPVNVYLFLLRTQGRCVVTRGNRTESRGNRGTSHWRLSRGSEEIQRSKDKRSSEWAAAQLAPSRAGALYLRGWFLICTLFSMVPPGSSGSSWFLLVPPGSCSNFRLTEQLC